MISTREYGRAALYGFCGVAGLCLVASIPGLGFAVFPLLFGAFAAALLFPEGIHSDHGFLYLALAAFLDFLLFSGVSLAVIHKRKA